MHMSDLCDEIARMGKGLGNPSRYRILEALMHGSKTVTEIVKAVKLTQPNVSQNLKVMKEAEIVTSERHGQEIYYSINVQYMASLLRKLALGVEKTKKMHV